MTHNDPMPGARPEVFPMLCTTYHNTYNIIAAFMYNVWDEKDIESFFNASYFLRRLAEFY